MFAEAQTYNHALEQLLDGEIGKMVLCLYVNEGLFG